MISRFQMLGIFLKPNNGLNLLKKCTRFFQNVLVYVGCHWTAIYLDFFQSMIWFEFKKCSKVKIKNWAHHVHDNTAVLRKLPFCELNLISMKNCISKNNESHQYTFLLFQIRRQKKKQKKRNANNPNDVENAWNERLHKAVAPNCLQRRWCRHPGDRFCFIQFLINSCRFFRLTHRQRRKQKQTHTERERQSEKKECYWVAFFVVSFFFG